MGVVFAQVHHKDGTPFPVPRRRKMPKPAKNPHQGQAAIWRCCAPLTQNLARLWSASATVAPRRWLSSQPIPPIGQRRGNLRGIGPASVRDAGLPLPKMRSVMGKEETCLRNGTSGQKPDCQTAYCGLLPRRVPTSGTIPVQGLGIGTIPPSSRTRLIFCAVHPHPMQDHREFPRQGDLRPFWSSPCGHTHRP